MTVNTHDREESFLSVTLPVISRSLTENLKEHVKGEMLEGAIFVKNVRRR